MKMNGLYAGIDVGGTSTKVLVSNSKDRAVVANAPRQASQAERTRDPDGFAPEKETYEAESEVEQEAASPLSIAIPMNKLPATRR